jgi:Domain of unknown function (DUF4160)
MGFKPLISSIENALSLMVLFTKNGDHSPRHVHIYRNGKLVAKWNLEKSVVMEGRVNRRLREIIKALVREGLL